MLWTTLISFILKHWMDAFNYHLSFLLLIFFICFRQCLLNIYVICNNRSLSLNIKLEYKEMHSLITREELRFIVAFQTLRLNISVGQLFIPRLSNNSLVLLSALSPTSVTYYLGDSWFLRFIYIKKKCDFWFPSFPRWKVRLFYEEYCKIFILGRCMYLLSEVQWGVFIFMI